jgi:predicted NAD-dependent protein-ADP-ribosyltransferase YbiA (DUF1768 family)
MKEEDKIMDIGSGTGYPSAALSNFAPHSFVIDGVECASMEGFLQSLKFSSPEMQKEVCKLVGKAAKFKGEKKSGIVLKHYIGKEKKLREIVMSIKTY